MVTPRKPSPLGGSPRGKARSESGRENQLTALAFDLAEQQLREGSASAMVITHFLKLKTEETKLREQKLRKEALLAQAKIDMMGSTKEAEEKYAAAVAAIRQYQGHGDPDEELE